MRRLIPAISIAILICTAGVSAPAGRTDHARVRREIRQVLAAPEYNQSHQPNILERFLANVGKTLLSPVRRFFAWVGKHISLGTAEGVSTLAVAATWAVVVAFVGLVGLVVWRLLHAGGRGGRPDFEGADVDYELPSAGPLMKQAAKLAEAGDYRGAFRAAYLASIAYLDGIRALRFERGRTNWEYMRDLRRGGHEKPYSELQPVTLDFDRKIYGREACHMQDYLNAAAVYERLSSEEAK